jgi:kynurenine formamidase
MKFDLTLKLDKKLFEQLLGLTLQDTAQTVQNLEKSGHIGTHFDVMDKEFNLQNIITKGRVFDISHIHTGEVKLADLDLSSVRENDFVMFYSGILKKYGFATPEYFATYIELSDELIDFLIEKKVCFIGVDMAGVKNQKGHERIDRYCADRGVFIIENLDRLDLLFKDAKDGSFTVYTFPVNWQGFSGLPCRVVAEV